MKPHPENPKRWRKAKPCRTDDRGQNQKSFKEAILQSCVQRNDQWSKDVQLRVQGAVGDLHAADGSPIGRYHDDCRCKLMVPCPVKTAATEKRYSMNGSCIGRYSSSHGI